MSLGQSVPALGTGTKSNGTTTVASRTAVLLSEDDLLEAVSADDQGAKAGAATCVIRQLRVPSNLPLKEKPYR